MSKIVNNIVPKETMRKIQSDTLNELADILKLSFGPNGSNSCIKKEGALPRYTKDGHTIIGSIMYSGVAEQSIKDDIESITRHIVKTVGDGTTSAVILSSLIFRNFLELEGKYQPAEIVSSIERVMAVIKNRILITSHEMTPQDVYDIAMISTNSNTFIANTLRQIYEEFGNAVYIDVTPGLGENTVIKSYNGMTLNTGYCDSCYVSNASNNTSEVDNPEVYFFEHPIDTRELGVYLDAILSHNIIGPCNSHKYNEVVPTVIFAPTISQDVSSLMDSLTAAMANSNIENRLPICVITGIHETEQLMDLANMCGAKMIRKYIDPKIYQSDVENGRAPTPETIFNWAGACDRVVAHSDKTVFIRPHKMYNEDGSYSNMYNSLLAYLESEIKSAADDGETIREVAHLKRRLHSLKSNMVELFIGGITQADRDSLRDLVEDAVLNIRSAGQHGVGFAANMTATMVTNSEECLEEIGTNELDRTVFYDIRHAYNDLVKILFAPCNVSLQEALQNVKAGAVYNIREKEWGTNVKSSIMSDVVILDTVTRIVGIMATCNQFILPTPMHNIYIA